MRILVTSDLHYDLKQFDWLQSVAAGYDGLIVAGDLLDIAGFLDLDVQIVVMSRYLAKLSEITKVMVCSGNHDGDLKNENGEHVANWLQALRRENLLVDGQGALLGEDFVSVCPWWDGEASKREMTDMLATHARRERRRWIWLHHAPPKNSKTSWTGKRDAGDGFLNQLIETHRPDLVFAGHIHNSPFRPDGAWLDRVGATWVFNPGRQPGAPPTTIQVDLEKMEAVYDSIEGREVARLQ